MKSLLAVSWCLPPMLFPRSIQVARLLKHLGDRGWRSTVVTADPSSLQRHRARDEALARFYSGAYRIVPVESVDDSLPMLAVWRALPALQMLPDARRPWIRPAIGAARRLFTVEPFDALASFAQPWSNHLVALRLKQEFKLPWLAHFSDPWSDSPYFDGPEWVRRRWRRWEEQVVRHADAVVFVTEETRELVMRKYPAPWRTKAHVVPHGYDPDIARSLSAEPTRHERLRLVYTGNFFAGRTPDGLVEAIASLPPTVRERLEIRFIGQVAPGYEQHILTRGVRDTISLRGPMPFLDSLKEAAAADVLLVVDAPNEKGSVFLPSKLVDYVMLRKPILGLTPLGGASGRLLDRLQCPVVPPDDPRAIAAALRMLLEQWTTGRLHVTPAFDRVAPGFSMDTAAAVLDRILSDVAMPGRAQHCAATPPLEPISRAK